MYGVGLVATAAALLLAYVWHTPSDDPAPAVEDFFHAVIDKDVDRALSHVSFEHSTVPVGEEAAFLHPDAIADGWDLLDVQPAPDTPHLVDVMIGDGVTTAETRLEVVDDKVVDPFLTVDFTETPFTHMQVNDRVVSADELYLHDTPKRFVTEFSVFPGLQQFFGDMTGVDGVSTEAELMLPEGEVAASTPQLSFTDDTQAAAQSAVEELIDDCAQLQLPEPVDCPFAAARDVIVDDEWYDDIRDVEWTVMDYPTATLIDPGGGDETFRLTFEFDDPGRIQLSGLATTVDDEAEFTAECEVDAESLRAALSVDGEVQMYQSSSLSPSDLTQQQPPDTCEPRVES